MKFKKYFNEYEGSIILETINCGETIEVSVEHKAFHTAVMKLGFVMDSPTVLTSTCLSGYEESYQVVNLMQEAFAIFDNKHLSFEELDLLGYEVVRS